MSSKYQLANGLTVILNESHKSPVVSVQMWVRTGSADEKKGEEGVSHFIEHLVFKGSEKYGVGQIAAVVEGSGGELNAYTSFDQTVYYVTISKEFYEVALDAVSQLVGFPQFDSKEIDNEREVVIEEIKRGNDSPARRASRLLFSTAYKQHAYGKPVIGYEKIIRKIPRKKIIEYFNQRYVPENMFLVVTGSFDSREMKKQVAQKFALLVKRKVKKVARRKEDTQKQPRLDIEKTAFQETHFQLAWKLPQVGHKDMAALDILGFILGQGESSRLVQSLRISSPLVNQVSAGTFIPKEAGLFVASANLNYENLDEFLAILKKELLGIIEKPIEKQELERAVINIESEEYYGQETVEGLARKAGSLEFLMKDYQYFPKYMQQVFKVTPADVLRVARTYLNLKSFSLTMMVPEEVDEKNLRAKLKTWIKQFDQERAENLKKKAVQKVFAKSRKKLSLVKRRTGEKLPVERWSLQNGVQVLFLPNYEVPCLAVKAAHLGGVREEKSDRLGVTELLSRTWTSGTSKMDEKEISLQLENSATGVSAFGGRNTVGLSLESLSQFEEQAADLFCDILVDPSLPKNIIDREKTIMYEHIKTKNDHPSQIAMQKFMETLFGEHPYARDPWGSEENLKKISREDLLEHWKTMSRQQNLLFTVTGFVRPELWKAKITQAAQRIGRKEYEKKTYKHQAPEKENNVFSPLKKEQAHILTGVKGITFTSPERYVLEVMQAILSGQGGRLFMELRDKKSLAYTVSPMKMEGVDTGYFGAYIGCSPEKTKIALAGLKEQLLLLADRSVESAELERAKTNLIGRHDIDLQKNSAMASVLLFSEIYGVSYQEVFQYAEKIRAVKSEDIRALAQRLFSQKFTTVVVGPNSPF